MRYLLDTNVLSESRKDPGDANVRSWLTLVPAEDTFISVISMGELVKGIVRLANGRHRRELQGWFDELERHFTDRILDVNSEIACLWGELTSQMGSQGRGLPMADSLIAATAIHHGLCLATRNTTDVQHTGVRLLNPWTA